MHICISFVSNYGRIRKRKFCEANVLKSKLRQENSLQNSMYPSLVFNLERSALLKKHFNRIWIQKQPAKRNTFRKICNSYRALYTQSISKRGDHYFTPDVLYFTEFLSLFEKFEGKSLRW